MNIPEVDCYWPDNGELPDDPPCSVILNTQTEAGIFGIDVVVPENGATIIQLAFGVEEATRLYRHLKSFVEVETASPPEFVNARGGDGC